MTVRDGEERTLADEFPELSEYLRSGLTVLDVGCGVGTITLDVAKVIEPGKIIGIDIDDEGISKAEKSLKERRLKNASFEVMDAHDLQFPDKYFDLVYSYTVAHYWWDPVKVLRELKRVAKPGAWIINAGIRDNGFSQRYPECPNMKKVIESIMKWMEARRTSYRLGSYDKKLFFDFYAGRKCIQWHKEAGVNDLQLSGSIESWWIPGKIAEDSFFYKIMSGESFLGFENGAIAEGYLDQEVLNEARKEGLQWVKDPHAFFFLTIITAKVRV